MQRWKLVIPPGKLVMAGWSGARPPTGTSQTLRERILLLRSWSLNLFRLLDKSELADIYFSDEFRISK